MSVAQLLLRGMIVGIVAGLLAFAFARSVGEPAVERAIAFEAASEGARGEAPEPEIVSRRVQSTLGLLTGVVVVGTALGGLFSLLFAFGYARVSAVRPRSFAAWLGLICFVTLYLVPALKYPANPPAVGEPGTIGIRTGLYFSTIGISVIAAVAAFSLRRLLAVRLDPFDAAALGTVAYVAMVAVAFLALPAVDEVPANFPAQVLWAFRIDSLGVQAILWSTLALLFGPLAERLASPRLARPAALGGRR